jgi:hypothetical protein
MDRVLGADDRPGRLRSGVDIHPDFILALLLHVFRHIQVTHPPFNTARNAS